MPKTLSRGSSLLAALLVAGLSSPSFAQTEAADGEGEAATSGIALELNNASDTDTGACRMSFVATNNTDNSLDRAGWQVGIFDAAGVVTSILMLDFGAMPQGKTKIVLFELPGRSCADISRVLVNDVSQCQTAGAGEEAIDPVCLDALETSSRAEIEFGV